MGENHGSAGSVRSIRHLVDDSLVVRPDVRGSDVVRADFPVVGVVRPHVGRQVELGCDEANTVVHVAVWWAPGQSLRKLSLLAVCYEHRLYAPAKRGDAEQCLDGFTGVVQLCKGFLVGERGHVSAAQGCN